MVERPVLTGYQGDLWDTFWEIHRYRLTPDGPRPMCPADIREYLDLYGLPHAMLERLWWHMRRLDDAFLPLYAERQKQLMREEREAES